MEEKDIKTDVLISGAGPSGLMMACLLAIHKIPFRIIDKKVIRENYSGAMILHARSMEILHQLGISLKILKEGVITRRINFQFNYSKNLSVGIADFGDGWSLFPYILILEQSKLEQLLMTVVREQGYEIEEGTTLLSFSQTKGIVTSIIQKPNGLEEVVTSRFLIGAGGSTSLVRRQLKIPFYGRTHSDLLFVSDSEFEDEVPIPQAELLFTFTKNQSLGFFPLPGNRWRLDGSIPNLGKVAEKVDFDYVEKYLNSDRKLNLKMINSTWFSVFRSHSRYAPALKHHHCFLVGDAAHVHSPVGAQGMNMGLQDAYNLAWKLAFFLKGSARATILETYQEERLSIAKNIIRYTDQAYLWITDNRLFYKYLRLYFFPVLVSLLIYLLGKFNSVRKCIFLAVSGTGLSYRKSPLSASFPSKSFNKSPLPGDRLPSFQYFIGSNIYNLQEKINYTSYKLLVFGVREIPDDIQTVVAKFNHVVEAEIIPVDPGTEEVYNSLAKKGQACYLVRPDLYIAWRSDTLDAGRLGWYLRKFLISANEAKKA